MGLFDLIGLLGALAVMVGALVAVAIPTYAVAGPEPTAGPVAGDEWAR